MFAIYAQFHRIHTMDSSRKPHRLHLLLGTVNFLFLCHAEAEQITHAFDSSKKRKKAKVLLIDHLSTNSFDQSVS